MRDPNRRLPTHRMPTHPGEMLREEFLRPMGITQLDFAKHLGDGYTERDDLPRDEAKILAQLRDAIGTHSGIAALLPRTSLPTD